MQKDLSVGILICSINKDGILLKCLYSLISNTDYKNYTIYLCIPPSVKSTIDLPNVVFVDREEGEPYKYSVFANRLVAACKEDFICLLNDDIEVISPLWLSDMLTVAKHPNAGVVGARLLFPDGTIQHIGCLLDYDTVCNHISYKESCRDTIPWNISREYTVVTGACSVMRKSVFEEVGGYEEKLVAYNDVDFCLKVYSAGYRNIYLATSALIHYESLTRGLESEFLEEDCKFMKDKWEKLLRNDPNGVIK